MPDYSTCPKSCGRKTNQRQQLCSRRSSCYFSLLLLSCFSFKDICIKLFHRKRIRFTSKANLGVVLMSDRDFERYKCLYQDNMDWIMILTTFWGTDCHVIIACISREENEDPKRPYIYKRFCNKTALNMNFLSNKTRTVLWPFISLDKAGSAQTYCFKIVSWLLQLKRCFDCITLKIKRAAEIFYCYPSFWQRKGIKYE